MNRNFKLQEGIILPVVLYGHEIWSLTLRDEHRLGLFEEMVMRIFGPKREKMVRGWRRLHSEELLSFYASANIRIIKSRIRWVEHVARM